MSGIFQHLMAYVFDPFWKYVTLLLHGNGTNGAQNNTFIDSSSNAFTITRNSVTTQGSVSPFGPNWSNSFNGTSGYLNASANAVFAFGTGSFTVEAWVYLSSLQDILLFDTRTSAATTGIGFQINSSGVLCYIQSTSTSLATTALTVNTWNHVAWVYNGTTVTGYVNGVAGTASTIALTLTQNNSSIGRSGVSAVSFMAGSISNLRVVKGTAVYTAAFTPPTAPLTAITNTSLLTCQSNRFKDNSTNNFAITATGTPSVQSFSPFSRGSAYSTSVIGGSGYFAGNSSLSLTQPTAFSFGTGDFTVEAWVYPTANTPVLWPIIEARTTAVSVPWVFGLRLITGNYKIEFYTGSQIDGAITIPLNAWTHVAFSRSGTSLKGFVNGVLDVNVVNSSTLNVSGSQYIGQLLDPLYATGYISNVRVVKGTAVYTAAFTPPTTPLTQLSGTSLLLNFVNGGIYDNAMQNNFYSLSTAQISTTQFKFGGGSMSFPNGVNYLINLNPPARSALETSNFTIEGWVLLNSIGVAREIVYMGDSPSGWSVNITSGNKLQFRYGASNLIGVTSLAASTWYHFAVVRSGTATGNVKIYLNGTADVTSGTAINNNFSLFALVVGYQQTLSTGSLNGYIDDLRITKAARYTANFTPPTSQLLDY